MQNMSVSDKIANFVSDLLEAKAEKGRTICFLRGVGEPDYSLDILLEEEQ